MNNKRKLVKDIFNFNGKETFTGVVKNKFNTIAYYLNSKLHRIDGPAIEWTNGAKEWFLFGKLHRTDGPAIEYANGYKAWLLNGKRHREDGPAIEFADDHKEWWLNDESYGVNDDFTNESWIRFVQLQILK